MDPLGVFLAREQHDEVIAVADQGTGAPQARLHLRGKPLIELVWPRCRGSLTDIRCCGRGGAGRARLRLLAEIAVHKLQELLLAQGLSG